MNTPTTPPTSDVPQDPDLPDVPATADPAPDDALADEVFVDDDATRSLPTTPSATSAAGAVGATGATTATVTSTPEAPEQEWLKGPAPFALVLGLLGLVVAGATLLSELADVNVPWDDLGPWSVVAAGIVVLLVGAIGLRSSRARH
jgi:hypothetical protein